MPPTLCCTDLKMRYAGQERYALGSASAGVSLEVATGELFALLGPSGCGKTTTLRIIGGFVDPSEGTVQIDGADVTHKPPYVRPTNTVFQSYALFPHKNVADNVAFGLKIKRVPREERRRRVEEALAMVGIGDLARRRVAELSGGQAQRVALARALVNRPAVLLLDEPLGALDLKLRRQMQDEIVRVKNDTSTSFVHVTHDQEEACAIADRIAVMNAGHIVQIATPVELYRSPRTAYVAEFINAGTILRGTSSRERDVVEVALPDIVLRGQASPSLNGAGAVAAVLPPGRVRIAQVAAGAASAGDGVNATEGVIERITFTGSAFDCHIAIRPELTIRAALTGADVAAYGGIPEHGTRVTVSWQPADVIFVEDESPVAAP